MGAAQVRQQGSLDTAKKNVLEQKGLHEQKRQRSLGRAKNSERHRPLAAVDQPSGF